jgi:hypothetical protein
MFIFIGDETNVTQSRKAKFFIYGGLLINADRALEAKSRLISIRSQRHFSPEDKFKFDTNSKPAHVSSTDFLSAKSEVLDVCSELGVQFMAYAVHHSIASQHGGERIWLWALNTLLCGYDLFLQREGSHGMCLVDRFSNDLATLEKIHKHGVNPQFYGGRLKHPLQKVWCYGTVSIDTTHLTSMVDIVLGAFRYCVNEIDRRTVTPKLYKKVRPLMVSEPGNPSVVEEWGLFLRPKSVKVLEYKRDYDNLRERLSLLEM